MTKPFSLEEVVARIRVDPAARRARPRSGNRARLSFADIELDEDTHEVWKSGGPVDAVADGIQLLRYFMINAGKVLSKAQILDHVWRYDFGGDVHVVESYVSYLRRKIDTAKSACCTRCAALATSCRAALADSGPVSMEADQ